MFKKTVNFFHNLPQSFHIQQLGSAPEFWRLLSETVFICLLNFFPLPRSNTGFSSLKMLPDSMQINDATLLLISLNGTQEIMRSETGCVSFIYGFFFSCCCLFVCLFFNVLLAFWIRIAQTQCYKTEELEINWLIFT